MMCGILEVHFCTVFQTDPEPVNNSQDECKIHNRNIKGKFF